MSKTKKLFAVLLAAVMLLSVFPVTVFAGFGPLPIIEAGENGAISWKIEGNILKISGKGAMNNFSVNYGYDSQDPLFGIETDAPWRDYRTKITTVVIENGVTTVGEYAFLAFSKLTQVFFPKTLKEIQAYAFKDCTALKKVYYEKNETPSTYINGNDAITKTAKVFWGISYISTISYTVKFNPNGGTGTMKEKSYVKDKTYTLPANSFKKNSYTFAGWNTKKDGSGKAYKNKASVKNLVAAGKSVTLYARWKLASGSYTVTYKLNGGKNNASNPVVYSSGGKNISLKNPTRSGYTFAGWYKNSKFTGSKVTKITASTKKNLTFYAKWVKTYTLQFVANSGSGKMSNMTCQVGTSEKLPANRFKRSCYTFTGWNTKKGGGGKTYKNKASVKNLSTKAGATVKLYAQWKLNKNCYTIKYTLNGGTNSAKNPKAYSGTGKNISLKNPTKTGYTFRGWYTKSDFSGDNVTKIAASKKKNVKLYAKWTANAYTVKFNTNGGSGTVGAKKYTYGKSYKLPANAFKKSGGYAFAGWNTKKDGSGKSYKNKATVKNLTAKNGATVTLYAQWNLTVTDQTELTEICDLLKITCEPLRLKQSGQSPSSKTDANGSTIWFISKRENLTWKFITVKNPALPLYALGSTYCSGWSTPYLTMRLANERGGDYHNMILNGTYDFRNDPGEVLVAWSVFNSSTTKAAFQKTINNKISDSVFNAVINKINSGLYGSSCVIFYGKDTDGKLIGKYAGTLSCNIASNAGYCSLIGINPKNTAEYGKTVNKTLIY